MRNNLPTRLPIIFGRLLLFLLLLLLTGACTLSEVGARRPAVFSDLPGSGGVPRVSVFLSLKESPSPAMRLEIANLEILSGDVWLPLLRNEVVLDSGKIGGGQLFLGGIPLAAGSYQRLRLSITSAAQPNLSGVAKTLLTEPLVLEIPLENPLQLGSDDSRLLLLTWDVHATVENAGPFAPVILAAPALRELALGLLYVSCPEIDTIFVVRSDTNHVVDSFGLRGGPTWLAIDSDLSSDRLYVLTPKERVVKVVDLETYRVIDFFPVPLNDLPTSMLLSPDQRAIYLLDERSGYLTRADLSSGRIMARVDLGYRPQFMRFVEEKNLLVVSLALSQKVLLLDPVSLSIRGSFSTGSRPQGFVFAENQLYVAEGGENSVAVFDLDSRARQDRIVVGFNPVQLLYAGNQIYVSHELEGMLTVLIPGQLGVIQEIADLGLPREMAYHPLVRHLYVVDRERGGVSVVDTNANLLLNRISLGALPFGLALLP